MDFRLIHSDNAVLSDKSTALNNYYSGAASITFVAADDKLYIGSLHPFNSIYLKLSAGAGSDAGLSVKYWDSSQWRSVVEVIDETSGMQNSGYLSWQVDRQYGWDRDDTVDANGVANIPALGNVTIYDKFWIEVSMATDVTFTMDWIGQIFSDDNELFTEYPELNNSTLLDIIKTEKTDYEEQNVRASRLLVEDLVARGIIEHQSQILDRTKMTTISVCKAAEIVYTMLGDDYLDQKRAARAEYDKRIKRGLWNVDLNGDGDLSLKETNMKQGFVYR